MNRPNRRGVLGGLAALSAPVVPALAVASPTTSNPDAELIRLCSRYLELERILNDPTHPHAAMDCDDMPEWPEYRAAERFIEAAIPQSTAGAAALAHVALRCSEGKETAWHDDTPHRIAHGILLRLAGGAA